MGQGSRNNSIKDIGRKALIAALMASTSIGIGVMVASHPAFAQAAAETTFSVPAGPLNQALTSFGRQAGLQVTYLTAIASGKTSPGISGAATKEQALVRILQGSGLAYSFPNSTTAAISAPAIGGQVSADGSILLETINVEGQGNATTEGSNSYGTNYASVTKDGASLKETPQSISVVTHKHIEDQNLTTLDRAIANTTGMTVMQGDSDRPYYFARGFQVNTVQFNGVPVNGGAAPVSAQDLAMFDRVEVLRGPAGLLSGLGSPGGTLNLVPKLPMSEFHLTDELSVGSYGLVRNQFDVTGPLSTAGSLRGRLVGTLESRDFVEDGAYRRLGQIYGVLEADLSDSTTVRAGAYYQRRPARLPWSGTPATADYKLVDVPRSFFPGTPWNTQDYMQSGGFAEIEHKFDNDWSTKATFNYIRFHSDVAAGSYTGVLDPVTLTGPFALSKWLQDDQQYALDWHATGPVSLFGREHKLLFGLNASHEDLQQKNYYCPEPNLGCSSTPNIFDVDSIPKPAFDGPILGRHIYTNKYSVYGSARISLADPLTLVVGGRVLWWDSELKPNAGENYYNWDQTHDRINAKPIPFAGIIYDLNDTYSLYASYAQIFEPQATRNAFGGLLKPIVGEQYEVGIKGSFLDDRLSASLALYDLTQQNRALSDPSDPSGTTYFAQGKARARGVDLEVSGQITDNWNIFAGYTYTDTKNYDTSSVGLGIPFSAVAPKHLFKLWTTYNLPGDLNKWTVGGGLYATSEFWRENAGGRLVADGYVNASAMVSYKFNDNFTASLNVDNIFDTNYIASLNGVTNGFYGAPRTFVAKLQAKW